MAKKSSEPKPTFREQMEGWLRKTLFPKRDTRYMNELDSTLTRIVDSHSPSASSQHADAKLELDARAWLRDFWTRTIVTWFALAISILALSLSYCSFETSKENREQLQKDPYQELLRDYLKHR
jgi:hypothetical protein